MTKIKIGLSNEDKEKMVSDVLERLFFIETVHYDENSKELIFDFENGNLIRISVEDLLEDCVTKDWINLNFYTKEQINNLVVENAQNSTIENIEIDNLFN